MERAYAHQLMNRKELLIQRATEGRENLTYLKKNHQDRSTLVLIDKYRGTILDLSPDT